MTAEYHLVRVRRPLMATTFEVGIPSGHPDAVDAASAALDLIDALEDQLTVYRDNSEVCRINATATTEPFVVEPHLFDLLLQCAGLTADTGGAFDIATGALIKAWGFYRREGRIPPPAELTAAMAATGMKHVVLNRESRTVKFRRPGLELNLGGVGKGYALDRAAKLLRDEWGVSAALLHGGGSSVVAVGHPPGDSRGWPVAIRHPHSDCVIGVVYLRDRALGTSAATYQSFEYNGRKYGHLLDPRTGRPADGMASVSVVAPTGAEADAGSTACFVLGDMAVDYLTPRPHLAAVLLADDGPLRTINLTPAEFAPT
jgi:thiamine biosynthesis lipoprotein